MRQAICPARAPSRSRERPSSCRSLLSRGSLLGAGPETAVQGSGGTVSASIRRGGARVRERPPRAAPHRRSEGGRWRHPARRRRIEAETAPPPPRTAVSVTLLGSDATNKKGDGRPGHRPFWLSPVGRDAYFLMPCMVARSAFSAAASARADAASTRLAADSARLAASSARVAACSARVAVPLSSCAHPAPITVTSIRLATLAPIDRKRIPLPPCCWSPQPGLEKSRSSCHKRTDRDLHSFPARPAG